MSKKYAIVGSFAMKPGVSKGFTVFSYREEDGVLEPLGTYDAEKNIGQRMADREKDCIYLVVEQRSDKGGEILLLRLNREDGSVKQMDQMATCANQPSYFATDSTGKYGVIPHHASDQFVVRTEKMEDGIYQPKCIRDEAALTLVRLNEEGGFERICDVASREERNGKMSHLHCAVFFGKKDRILVCDKGQDNVYVYGINKSAEVLTLEQTLPMEEGSNPRYAIVHPKQQVIYQNYERRAYINVLAIDPETERVAVKETVPLFEDQSMSDSWKEEGASDLVLDREGKHLYVSVRSVNQIVVFAIQEDGSLRKQQMISCGGKNPRGLALAPDEKYLFSQNRDSDTISKFVVQEDGTLSNTQEDIRCNLPGNMVFV